MPFPCPVTGSMIPCSAISRSKAVHLVGFRSSTLCTSDLPNTISFPKASCNLQTCEAVFAVKSSSMFTFLFSMFTFSRVNVHFFRFFKSAADVQYPVMKRMILVQQEIAKEYLKEAVQRYPSFQRAVLRAAAIILGLMTAPTP